MTRLLSKYATLLKMNKRWNAGYKNKWNWLYYSYITTNVRPCCQKHVKLLMPCVSTAKKTAILS